MRDAGVDPAPWLDTAPVRVTAALVGDRATRTAGDPHVRAELELALSGDPLEVFAMGTHFGTCLSPGSMSFFSVVANAADINKRVL